MATASTQPSLVIGGGPAGAALVRRPAQVALGAAARLWPGLMSSVAFHTRVSDAALSRTMLASHP